MLIGKITECERLMKRHNFIVQSRKSSSIFAEDQGAKLQGGYCKAIKRSNEKCEL